MLPKPQFFVQKNLARYPLRRSGKLSYLPLRQNCRERWVQHRIIRTYQQSGFLSRLPGLITQTTPREVAYAQRKRCKMRMHSGAARIQKHQEEFEDGFPFVV